MNTTTSLPGNPATSDATAEGNSTPAFLPEVGDIFLIGVYTGMRREQVDMERRILRVETTETGEPFELPITQQLSAIFEGRLADGAEPAAQQDD